ncbi:MAG: FAD-dependent oxidoreductase [Candidatus Melainabacteria bacterium]|nr:FAD-dependent oxidoreductase [Candidatus Melainabacteria bacterium]
MTSHKQISVLGGGPAGLASGYFASKKGYDLSIYEANSSIGGNAITFQYGDFLYDSGAHRFHDKDPEVTEEVKLLLGDDLHRIDVPSQIYHEGRFIDFPISPLNLLSNIGMKTFIIALREIVHERLFGQDVRDIKSLYEHACKKYGFTLADKFLLNYSEKLWGSSCNNLSHKVSGSRIKGLDLTTFITEAFLGKKAKTRHLDGAFYYPAFGIGMITDKLADACGKENIYLNSKITKVFHDFQAINAIEINGKKIVELKDTEIISTLPVSLFINLLEPLPDKHFLDLVNKLKFRSLLLIGLFLNKESVTQNSSVYFPDKDFPFTRVYEPRNRSKQMSPPGKTSLIVELPCSPHDKIWKMKDSDIVHVVASKLFKVHGISHKEVIGSTVKRMNNAYPILEVEVEDIVHHCIDFLNRFKNLRITGRNGKFLYTHLHDMIRFGKDVIDSIDAVSLELDTGFVERLNIKDHVA